LLFGAKGVNHAEHTREAGATISDDKALKGRMMVEVEEAITSRHYCYKKRISSNSDSKKVHFSWQS